MFRTAILCAVVLLAGTACTTASREPGPEAAPLPLTGENHSFALYNDRNRLIHSPIEHLERELARREAQGGRSITDVYVLSHGWNFTLEESARLWESYRLAADRELGGLRGLDPEYEPFMIF